MGDVYADGVDLFDPLLVLLIQIIVELNQISLPAHLGLSIGKIQTGIDRLFIYIEFLYRKQTGIQF